MLASAGFLALCIASAAALDPASCVDVGTATTVTYDFANTCYKGSSATVDITINIPSAMNNKYDLLLLWNVDQSASYAGTVTYESTTKTTVTLSNVNGMGPSSSAMRFYNQKAGELAAGEHHIRRASGVGNWAFVVKDTDSVTPEATVGGTPASYDVLPFSGTNAQTTVSVTGGFVSERVMVRGLTASVTPAATAAGQTVVSASSAIFAGATTSAATVSRGSNAVDIRFNRVSRPTADSVSLQITFGATATDYYDWATNGPFFTGTISIPSSNVEYYPKIASGGSITMNVTATGAVSTDYDIVEIDNPSILWWTAAVDSSSMDSTGYKISAPDVYISENPSSAAFSTLSWSTRTTGNNYMASGGLVFQNGNWRITNPSAATPSNVKQLAPVSYSFRPRYFLRIVRRSTQPSTGVLTSVLTVTVSNLQGECTSYQSCIADDSQSHPSLRFKLSASSDATKFTRCSLIPSAGNPYKPSPMCTECVEDCDCEEGSYCHKDPGVCTDASGNQYMCDSYSNSRFGVCTAKDPGNEIIGSRCRSTSGATYGAGTSKGAVEASLALIGTTLQPGFSSINSTQSGHRFCGGAGYFNASNLDGTNSEGVARASVARAIYWTGSCLDGICHECSTGSATCSGSRQCINGRSLNTISVDGTARTFAMSTLAGTTLATALMVVLAILIVTVDCACRHSWRASDVDRRKKHDAARSAQTSDKIAKSFARMLGEASGHDMSGMDEDGLKRARMVKA